MILHDVKQGSSEWFALRAGRATASEFGELLTPDFKPRTGDTPRNYLMKKVAEKVMGFPMKSYGGGAVEQGALLETEALPWFSFAHDVEVKRVGFCTTDDGTAGCSPDGLIGEDGGIELKCPEPHTHVGYLLGGVVPKQYLAQVHGSMFVTGRKWWYFMSYNRYMPKLLVKVQRDDAIQQAIGAALAAFNADLDKAYSTIQAQMAGAGRA